MFNLLTSDTKRSITAIFVLIYSIITLQRNMKDNIFYKWQPNHITCGLIYHKYIFILTIVTISSATFIMFYLCSCEIFRRPQGPLFQGLDWVFGFGTNSSSGNRDRELQSKSRIAVFIKLPARFNPIKGGFTTPKVFYKCFPNGLPRNAETS